MKPLFTFASDVKRSDWIYHAEYADSAICPLLLCAIKVLHSHAGVGFRGRAVDVTSREGPQSTHCGNSNIDSTLSKLGAGTLGKSGASLVQVRRRAARSAAWMPLTETGRMWMSQWGPRPDQDGCLAPDFLL